MMRTFRRWLARLGEVNVGIALFSLTLIVMLWSVVIAAGRAEREEAIATAIKQNSNLAVAYEEHVIRTLKGLDAVTRFIRHEYERLGTRLDITRYIADGVIDTNLFSILSVVDEHGTIVASSQAVPRVNYADREHFKAHLLRNADELYISRPVLGRVSHTWQVPMTRRIDKPDGTFGGVVVLSVDPGYFTRFYQKADLGDQGLVMLAGLDGIARARRVGRVLSFGDDMSASNLLKEQAANGVGNFFSPGRSTGVSRYISYRTLHDYPLVVAVGASEADVLAEFLRNSSRDYWTALLVSIVIALFAALLIVAVTRQKRASAALAVSEARFRATFEQAAIGIAHTSLDHRYLAVNRTFCGMLGYSREELLGQNANGTLHAEDQEDDQHTKRLLAGEVESVLTEKRYVRKDGTVIWGNRTVSLVRDGAGVPLYFLRVIEDITRRKGLEAKLRELATTDTLTGLTNRRHFLARLEEEHARLQRFDVQHAAVLMVDIDHFKRVNDSYGHPTGDAVLRHFADVIRSEIREVDTGSRLGGEEFAIILAGATPAAAREFAERLRGRVAETPVAHDGHAIPVTVSIGIAGMSAYDGNADASLVRADAALYRAKQGGRNRVELVPD